MSRHATHDVVIVGGGLAGTAAACLLARAGRPVQLVEASAGPVDKICGEFISGEAQHVLRQIGVDLLALGGEPISHVRLVRDQRVATVRLPFSGMGLSRRTLDEALLEQAAAWGATVWRGKTARLRSDDAQDGHTPGSAPGPASGPPCIEVAGLGELRPRTLLLATGKHELRGLRRAPMPRPNDLVGFKMYFKLNAQAQRELTGHVEVMLFAEGYAGLQRVDGGRANLCLLVERAWLQRCEGRWALLLQDLQRQCRHLHARLHDAQALWPKPLSIFKVPYGFVHEASDADPAGVFRLGDQMGVIASFVGDGMAIALHSASVAAGAVQAQASAHRYHQRMHQDIAGQIGRAALLYRAGCSPYGQRAMVPLARAWPRGVQWAARLTRVPPDALTRAFA